MSGMIHIHAPAATAKAISITLCLDCKQRTRMIQFFTPWYGWDSTCIKCGRNWQDGEWADLPFCNGLWGRDSQGKYRFMKPRRNNIEIAKNHWRAMPPVSENHYGDIE